MDVLMMAIFGFLCWANGLAVGVIMTECKHAADMPAEEEHDRA